MQNISYKNVPNCLRKYRKVRGLKQKDVALILGLKNTSMISRWENGTCLPNTMNTFKLAALYRTMIDALFVDLVKLLKDDLLNIEEEILKALEKDEDQSMREQ